MLSRRECLLHALRRLRWCACVVRWRCCRAGICSAASRRCGRAAGRCVTLACSRCATGLGVSCRLRGSAGGQVRRSCLLSRFVSGRAHTCGQGSGHRVRGMRARMHASDEPVSPADVAVVLICPCAPFAMCSELAWRLAVCANVCAEHYAVCVVGAYVGCSAHEPCEWSWPECWGARAPQCTACSPS